MNMTKFAALVSYITAIASRNQITVIHEDEIGELASRINSLMPEVQKGTTDPVELETMLMAMKQGKKIEAIKSCRTMTYLGLKEAKDLVERYTVT